MVLGIVYVTWLASYADPERDGIWLLMMFVDFPAIYAYAPIFDGDSTLLLATGAFLCGGLQWALMGMGLDFAFGPSIRKRFAL